LYIKIFMTYNPIYDPIEDQSLDNNHCFLCGKKLTRTNRTIEHIFPKWLLNRFSLWEQTLTLPNLTTIKYKQIKIPCCKDCNNAFLGAIENRIEKASSKGYKYFNKLPRKIIFLWLLKIYYELRFMDLRLLLDQKDNQQGTIINKEILEEYRMCHLFLQAVRIKVKIHKPCPWSIFIVPVQKYDKKELDFDFRDNSFFLTIAIRMGDIGIIACLQDNNTQYQMFSRYFTKFKKVDLHPLQFSELVARVFYKESLRNRTPSYITFLGDNHLEVITNPLGGFSSQLIYNEWVQSDYAQWLSFFLHLDYDQIYVPPNKVWSLLFDEKHHIRKIDIKTCSF